MGQRYKEFSFALLIAGTFFHPAFPASSEQKKGTMKPHGLDSPQCVKIYAAKIAVFFLSTYIPSGFFLLPTLRPTKKKCHRSAGRLSFLQLMIQPTV